MALKYTVYFSHISDSLKLGDHSLWFSSSKMSGLTSLQFFNFFFTVTQFEVTQVFKLGGRAKGTLLVIFAPFTRKLNFPANYTQTSSTYISLKYTMPDCAHIQLCPALCDPLDNSLPGSSVHGIFQQEYWSRLPFPPPGDLPNPGIKSASTAWQVDSLSFESSGKP